MQPKNYSRPSVWLSCLALATTLLQTPEAQAAVANVALNKTAYVSGSLYAGDQIAFLTDGNRSRQIHASATPDLGFNYTVDLGQERVVRKLTLYPRQDGCCPERLRNFRVSLHSDSIGTPGDEVWGQDLLTGANQNAGSGQGIQVSVDVNPGVTAHWIKIQSLESPVPDYALQMTELEVYADIADSEINRALNAQVAVNGSLYPGMPPSNLVDGSRGTVAHASENPPVGFSYTINLGGVVQFSSINIYPRQDNCCADRLSNYRVTLHKSVAGNIGPVLWVADLHNDASNPGSAPGSVDAITPDLDPLGTFEGQYIVITSLDDPVPNYALQISEIEAFGTPQGDTSILVSTQPSSTSTALGRTAQFSVVANAVNGDPTQLSYQWQRNGINIAGATSATLITAPTLLDDDLSKYRCIISYPGLASVTSDEVTLRLNRAYQSRAFTNRPLWAPGGWNISQLVDGDRGATIHGDNPIEAGFAYTVDLGAEVQMEEIRIYPRQDGCCPERLRNIRVSVHKDNAGTIGDSSWSADLYTDGSNAGSGAGVVTVVTKDASPDGTFKGQWIEILNLEDPVTPYALQISEIEVIGSYTVGTPLLSFVSIDSIATGVPGRPVTLKVVPKVINGEASKITYRWTRDGVAIPGSSSAQYTTAPLVDADTNAVFRCILSYPGVADLVSEPMQIVFDYNYARNQPASSNRPLWGPGNWNISQIVDGNRLNTVHGDAAIDPGFAYTINLGINIQLDHIDIYPRQDGCCPERLKNLHVSLHPDNNGEIGDENWSADILTDSNAGSGAGIVVTVRPEDGGGVSQGSWLKITALDDPIVPYSLQLTEIEVFGVPAGGPERPVLVFENKAGALELRWSSGIIESAGSLSGPWTAVPNATSPYTVPSGPTRFFRINQ